MIKKVIHSSLAKKVYESSRHFPWIYKILTPLANNLSMGYLRTTKEKLKAIGPSFCTAKWMQSTIHLGIGETHSCHHPPRHKIETKNLLNNPSGLHNTKVKAEARRQMVKGEFPEECHYCWKVETQDDYSDRVYKSSSDWAQVDLKELCSEEKINNVNPSYLEISFSSDCNLKCAYCDPKISSAIHGEIERHGPYPTSQFFQSLEKSEEIDQSSYLKAFWQWWDQGLRHDLKVLRITGGEPLLSNDFFKLLEKIDLSDEKLNLDLAVNSNLMIGTDTVREVIGKAKRLVDQKKVKSFLFYTSIDTWGRQAEFLRFGLRTDKYAHNIETALETFPELDLTFLVTYQALSPFNFNQFLEYVLSLRKRHLKAKIKVGISSLHYPNFLSLQVLKKSMGEFILGNLNFMKKHRLSSTTPHGFSNFEIQHLERNYNFFLNNPQHSEVLQDDFLVFIKEYEKRKNLNFYDTFSIHPEDLIR